MTKHNSKRRTAMAITGSVLAASVAVAVAAHASGKLHWGYGVENGPKHWATLSSDFELCGKGKHQSPVNLASDANASSKQEMTFDYRAGPGNVVNNGHSIQVNVADGNSMTVNGKSFKLLQFHFHTPSENTIDGLHYPMEAHLVHKSDSGQLAVISVMVQSGNKSIVDQLPKPANKGDKAVIENVDATAMLPVQKSFKSFEGSLTTPPCSEGVAWFVMDEPLQAGNETIAEFYSILGANNRPTHPLNGRKIVKSD